MKRHLMFALAALISVVSAMAQEPYYEVNTAPDVRSRASRPNEVIVKFNSDGAVNVRRNAKGKLTTTSVNSIDKVLAKYSVAEAEQLMPLSGTLPANAPRRVKAYNGQTVEMKDMSKLYCLKLSENSENSDVSKLIEELMTLPEVEFAEPNYLVYACATPDDWTTDPLYTEQWGIPAINLPQLWTKPLLTTKRPVIAILDTGVEIAHPDLAANIWTNTAEVEGSTGYDDDQNGYADDLHGWDFVNQTGYIDDYNGHGTHCAGIAAATGGNGLGIVGANPDALIMSVTVMQSDGVGDIATIIKGIDYAAANGADVISMSFGGYSYSIAEEQALGRAYAKAVLVAAAGNDGMCINPHKCPPPNGQMGSPMFPAAFTFVLGVQATTNGGGAGFSNYDDDGPIYFNPQYFSEEQMYNYELSAPGVNIISTFSNGGYKALSGTSMACPLVAGAVSRLLQTKEYPTKELLFGDLIHAAGEGNVNMLATYNITDADRKPNVSLVSWRIEDEKDNDGRFDAGETIKFYPMLRNNWGTAENILVWMEMGDQESHSVLSFTQAMADFSKPLSSYAKAESENPIKFKLADNVVDGRHIRLMLYVQCDGMDEPSAQEIVITAENGVEIGGIYNKDTTLEPGVNYIVTRQILVPSGVTFTIKPGVTLKFKSGVGITSEGNFVCSGTPEQPIIFTNRDLEAPEGDFSFKVVSGKIEYVILENLNLSGQYNFSIPRMENCIVRNCTMIGDVAYFLGKIYSVDRSQIYDNSYLCYINSSDCSPVKNSNLLGNIGDSMYSLNFIQEAWFSGGNNVIGNIFNGNIYSLGSLDCTNIFTFRTDAPSYFGSREEDIVRRSVLDSHNSECLTATAEFDLSNMLTQPNPEAHGVLWKVVVDGYDAQDEFNLLPPLGVGRHKFEVWYSKKIDEAVAPTIAMGVRPPYTQTAIAEDGSWRTETVKFKPNGNVTPAFKNLAEAEMGIDYLWKTKISSGLFTSRIDKTGFDGIYYCLYSINDEPFVGKLYQDLDIIPNGVYKFTFKVQPDNLAGNKTQYIYANNDKTYIDSTEPKVYEVITTVTNHRIEVGFEQIKGAGMGSVYLDDVNLELIEQHPDGYDLDVSVYTAYLDIKGGMAIDGLNRIYVNGGQDLEYFDIPIENRRFNVEVAAAGSMSTGFFGEAGIGKVTLTWEEQDENVDDILGYNMYRYEEKTRVENVYCENPETGEWGWYDKTIVYNDTVKINQRLLTDTEYVDYDVVPGTTYNYYYKIMRTSLTENSPSKVVAVTPVTASKGDSNGSMTVDVADVVTTVGYLTGQNPQPFLFEAADVNSDEAINILDIVGTINIIVNPAGVGTASVGGEAVYTIEDGVLWVETPVALGGVQVSLSPALPSREGALNVTPCAALDGFEIVNTGSLLMAYSMSGKTLAPGRHALLQLGEAEIGGIVLSDVKGHNVAAAAGEATAIATVEAGETCIGTPDGTTIPYYIAEAGRHNVRIEIYDALGHIQHIWNGTADSGRHTYTWNAAQQGAGMYLAVLKVDGKYIGTAKLVKSGN